MNEMDMIIDTRRKLGDILSCAVGPYLREHDLIVLTNDKCSTQIAEINEYTHDFGFLFESCNQCSSYEYTLGGHIVGDLAQALACINKPLTFSVHFDVGEETQIVLTPSKFRFYRLSVAALVPVFCWDVIGQVRASVTQLWMEAQLQQEWKTDLVDK